MDDFKAKALEAFQEKLQKKSGEEIQELDIRENGNPNPDHRCYKECYHAQNKLNVHYEHFIETKDAARHLSEPIMKYFILHPDEAGRVFTVKDAVEKT